jgi:hypothetical protein
MYTHYRDTKPIRRKIGRRIIGKKASFTAKALPSRTRNSSLFRQNAVKGGTKPPSHSGTCVGAPVAFLSGRFLRTGIASVQTALQPIDQNITCARLFYGV